jgi:hypothetical protein
MVRRLLLTAALMGLVASLVAQSPPPTTTPTKAAQEKQDVSDIENRQTQTANSTTQTPAATVNQTTPKPAENNAQTQRAPNRNVSSFNWSRIGAGLLLLFNALLVGVGYLQWRSIQKQAGYMRDGLKVTERAAEAAQKSAEAAKEAVDHAKQTALVTERAVVVLENARASPTEFIGFETVIIFTLRNFGETVAHAVKLKGDLTTLGGTGFLRDAPEVTLAPQGANQWITSSLGTRIGQDYVIKTMNTEEGNLRYEIEVTYSDVFGKSHWHKAEGHYVPLLKEFINTSSSSD